MSAKTDTEVIIGGKVLTVSGNESVEYLQKVASYINNKTAEYAKVESFKRQPLDTQSVLLQLNIADDYFKAKRQISLLEEEIQGKEKELYNLKTRVDCRTDQTGEYGKEHQKSSEGSKRKCEKDCEA